MVVESVSDRLRGSDARSGNCYKIRLLRSLLQIPYEWVDVDVLGGETRKPGFLSMNPDGRVPVPALPDGRFLSGSNAILNFLAASSACLPEDRFELAQVQQWQFFEQYSHEPFIAVARFVAVYPGLPEDRRAEYESKQPGGHKALSVMEKHLTAARYFVADRLTTADISLYAYTHVAQDGGFDLARYPAVRRWLGDIASHPKYVGMVQ